MKVSHCVSGRAIVRSYACLLTRIYIYLSCCACTTHLQEMYTFKDNSGKSVTLRPEGTAGTVAVAVMIDLTWQCTQWTHCTCFCAYTRALARWQRHWRLNRNHSRAADEQHDVRTAAKGYVRWQHVPVRPCVHYLLARVDQAQALRPLCSHQCLWCCCCCSQLRASAARSLPRVPAVWCGTAASSER